MAADFTEPSSEKPVEDRLEELADESSTPSIPTEADAADVVEQNLEVPIDDEDVR